MTFYFGKLSTAPEIGGARERFEQRSNIAAFEEKWFKMLEWSVGWGAEKPRGI